MQGTGYLNTILIMEKQINIPKLRFPEFVSEWDKKKLNEVATFINGKAYKQEELLDSGKYPVLRVGNFFSNNSWYYSDLELDKNKYCDNGDLLYAWSASFGPKIWDGKRTIYHYHIWKVICSNDIQKKYLYYILDEQTLKMKTNSSNGFALLHITKGTIENWQVTIPKITEQTKIANFLTTVDYKITQLKKKKSLLEKYKKGVMQKLFYQELRFKDENGNDFAEWDVKKLGAICKIYDGTHQTPDYKEQGIPFYSVEHVTSNNFNSCKFISNMVFEKENIKVRLEKGDILMTKIGDIGKAKYINWDVNASFYVSLALIKQSKYNNNEFVCHCINSEQFQLELHKRTIHVAFPKKINLGEIGECLINLPCLQEQTKIANFISAIDDKINHCGALIEKMEGWKKGLLQKMFV